MKKIYCIRCGTANKYGARFCVHCGSPLQYGNNQATHNNQSRYSTMNQENIFQSATRTVNSWTGENKSVPINLHSFFAQVFVHHTEAEAENIFIAGTPTTTPTLDQVSGKPVQPWLYSRVFISLMIAVGLLLGLINFLDNQLVVAFIALLSVSVPVSLMVFFFEINVFKNISIYMVMKIFLIGGLMSLIVALIIYSIVGNSGRLDLPGSLAVGFIEETGKVLVGCYFVNRLRLTHVFNGMLVGGAIGAGFAAFENIQYATISNSAYLTPILRSIGSLGTHAIWCAITVSALVLVKGTKNFSLNYLLTPGFLKFFICAVILHALWDWDLPMWILKMIILIIAGWLILFVLIHTGLREVKFIQRQIQDQQRIS